MKPEELIGGEIIGVAGEEGCGCGRCGVPAGRPEYRSLLVRLPNGVLYNLRIQGICPPDMETGYRKQRIVAEPLDNHKE